MNAIAEPEPSKIDSYLHTILDTPEHDELRRLTSLVQYVFRVPVAYLALLGDDLLVSHRIGSGTEYWHYLMNLPLDQVLRGPLVVNDLEAGAPGGCNLSDLRFLATAPLQSSNDTQLGVLVIADREPRPEFSEEDTKALSELAAVLAVKMELRAVASEALESALSLRETEQRFRSIANSAPVLILYGSTDGHCSFVNKTWLDFTGRSLAEELGDGFADSFHPDSREIVAATYWRAFQERRPFSAEFPMRRHDGAYRWMISRGVPRFREDGIFAGYIGCLIDVTDHHDALLEVQKQAQCTAAVANATGVTYLVLDPEGRIDQLSPICQRASGRTPHQMRGRYLWEACIAARHDTSALRDAFQRAATASVATAVHTKCDAPDGCVLQLAWLITPILSEDGALSAMVVTLKETDGRDRVEGAPRRCGCGNLSI